MRALNMMRAGIPALSARAISGGIDQDLATTASGTTSQSGSYAIKSAFTEITTCAINNGALLPATVDNGDTFVVSNKGANQCLLYPPSGGTLNNQAANAPLVIPVGSTIVARVITNLNWLVHGADQMQAVPIAGGATLTVTAILHAGKTINWDTVAGSVLTLPAAVGNMAVYRCIVSVLATSNSHVVKVANANDIMRGLILGSRVDSGNAVLGFATAVDSDTITLNRTTTGSVSLGEWVELQDIAANKWQVTGVLSATGAAFATPFSAAV